MFLHQRITRMADRDPAPPAGQGLNQLGAPGLRAFFKVAELWALTELEQMRILGITKRTTLQRWRAKAQRQAPMRLTRNNLERISCVLGIYKAINILFPIPARADRWMRAANRASIFRGRTAIDRMAIGNVSDLEVVRQYLDAQLT